MTKEPRVESPEMRQVLEALKELPSFLEERKKKLKSYDEFLERVFSEACREAFGVNGEKIRF